MTDPISDLSMHLSPEFEEVHVPGFWYHAGPATVFPENAAAWVKVGERQIAVFYLVQRGEWYACQELCPHCGEMGLSRGLLDLTEDMPTITCTVHKKTFSLETGECLNGDVGKLTTYPVRIEEGHVLIGVPLDVGPFSVSPDNSGR